MEIWKDIQGYEGLYQVSSLGQVRNVKTGRIRVLCKHRDGYLKINLTKNGKTKTFMVHRLVANAFIPNKNNLPQVNHKDENKINNSVDNLEWCTAEYNTNYGSRTERATLNSNKSIKVCAINLTTGDKYFFNSISECVRELSLNNSCVKDCIHGKQKTHRGYRFEVV